MNDVILIKLGGAVITNKDIPESVREGVLDSLVEEIATIHKETKAKIIIGNGAGSFGHVPAVQYKTKQGFISEQSRMGMAITQDSAARLNRIVVASCLRHDLPAVTVAPSNSLVTAKTQASAWFSDVFEEYLRRDLLPVTYGDVIVDTEQGCTIWSTDTVFSFFARQFHAHGWNVKKIVHVTEAHGVWKRIDGEYQGEGEQRVIFDTITEHDYAQVASSMTDTKGFDVTGGMLHKVEEALALTKLGIETQIISGLKSGNLTRAILENGAIGTRITTV